MIPSTRRPRRTAFVVALACVATLLGATACREGGDDAGPAPSAPPVSRLAAPLGFEQALAEDRVSEGHFSIGAVARPGLRSDPNAIDRRAAFDSDPVEVEPGTEILLTTGMWLPDGDVPALDRPRFTVDAIGPDGESRLLESIGQRDFDPSGWSTVRRTVPEAIGSPVTFRFGIELSDETAALDGRSLPLWGVPRLLRPASTKRPSVLFVVFDTLRADRTDPYGRVKGNTPFLSQLATRGALVEEFVSTYPTTLSSHWSMFSGLFPARHGIYPGTPLTRPRPLSMAEVFHDAGYRTAAFTEGGFVHSLFGFDKGFDLYHNGPDKALDDLSGSAAETFGLALDWLSALEREPFFMFLHTYEVHTPYDPDPEFTPELDPDYDGRWTTRLDPLVTFAINSGKFEPTDAEFDRIQQLYEAEIRGLDDAFSRFWARLEALGLVDDTIVVITSDHGEDFWEHGWLSHGTTLYDPALLVPFLVVAKGRVAENARLACQRSQTDLMPTLLDLAGLPVPADLDGHSMREELERGVCEDGDDAAYSELLTTFYDKRPSDLPIASLRKRGWKVIRHTTSGDLEAYDLRRDPDEQQDASDADADADAVEALAAELDAYLRTTPEGADADMSDLPQDVRDRLEALGYGD
jgi:arylsulfatase A-like enzyme